MLQLQEDVCRQTNKEGSGLEREVDLQMRMNKELMMNSLWKLNVVDIEVTLLHVCQMVCHFIFCLFIYFNWRLVLIYNSCFLTLL